MILSTRSNLQAGHPRWSDWRALMCCSMASAFAFVFVGPSSHEATGVMSVRDGGRAEVAPIIIEVAVRLPMSRDPRSYMCVQVPAGLWNIAGFCGLIWFDNSLAGPALMPWKRWKRWKRKGRNHSSRYLTSRDVLYCTHGKTQTVVMVRWVTSAEAILGCQCSDIPIPSLGTNALPPLPTKPKYRSSS